MPPSDLGEEVPAAAVPVILMKLREGNSKVRFPPGKGRREGRAPEVASPTLLEGMA